MIEVKGLRKSFGLLNVLRGVDFDVPRGSITGFVGPNGVGKTTTMRILATLERATEGSVRIAGHDVNTDPIAVRRCIGYMPDYPGTYPNLNAGELLDFYARAAGLRGAPRRKRLDDVIAFTEVGIVLDRPVDALSKGQQQRLSLARTLLADPEVLILDEPAAGLDPRARIELRELLRVLAGEGKTVFVSSHILSELADLIDRLVIIDHGKIRHAGRPDEVGNEPTKGEVFVIEVTSSLADARRVLLEQQSVLDVAGEEANLMLRIDTEHEPVEDLLARLVTAGVRFRQFYREETNIEDVFLSVTRTRSDAPPT
jgi:ABC-2 type transport system ATP-binding protein